MTSAAMRVSPPPSLAIAVLHEAPSRAAFIRGIGTRHVLGQAIAIFSLFIFGRKRKSGLPPSHVIPTLPRIKMEPGTTYLLPSDKPDMAFRIFTKEISNGASGMVITRLHPGEVRAKFNVGSSSIHWLSRAFTKDSMSPTNLGAVAEQVEIFVSKTSNPVVLLDGIEYLIVQNDLQKVVRFISSVRDSVALHRACMVIPFNMQSVDESGRALITRDLHVIKWND
jgi:hypothetical protein